MNIKQPCFKCKKHIAVWKYMPISDHWTEEERYFCDRCVSRGCGCNVDFLTGEENKDERGRSLPCIEYDYKKTGYNRKRN